MWQLENAEHQLEVLWSLTINSNFTMPAIHFFTSATNRYNPVQSTPHRRKVGSNPHYYNQGYNRRHMDQIMHWELDGAVLHYAEKLIDHIFPDDVLPFSINQSKLEEIGLHDGQNWIKCPEFGTADTERHVAAWLNNICARCCSDSTIPPRVWNSYFCTKALRGGSTNRKPDIILVNGYVNSDGKGWSWSDVHCIIEVTKSITRSDTGLPPSVRKTLDTKAFLVFEA